MKNWPLRVMNYLAGFLVLSSVHCLAVALILARDRGTFLYSLVYLPVVIILSESRKRAPHFWQYACFIAVSVGIVNFINRSEFERVLSIVFTLAAAALYFYARAKKADCYLDTPEYYFLTIFVVMYLLERQYPSPLLEKYAIIGAGIYLLLCMFKTNIYEMNQLFDLNGKLERFPQKRLIKNNLLMMGIQTVFVVMGMFAAMFVSLDGFIERIILFLRKIVTWILQWMESKERFEYGTSEKSEQWFVLEAGEQSAFMQLLMKIFDVLATMLVIGLTLYFIYRIIRKLYQLYLEFDMTSVDNGDEIENINAGWTKEERKTMKRKKTEKLFWDQSPNAKVRKYYKRRVMKDLKERPKSSMTPEEIEQRIVMEKDKKRIFHGIYEKARYGNMVCTKEDAEEMRVIIR